MEQLWAELFKLGLPNFRLLTMIEWTVMEEKPSQTEEREKTLLV